MNLIISLCAFTPNILYLAARPLMLLRYWCESSQSNNKVLNVLRIQIQNTFRCRIRWERSLNCITSSTELFAFSLHRGYIHV